MAKKAFLLLLEFAVLTVPLTWWWVGSFQAVYTETIFPGLAEPLLGLFGVSELPESPAQKRFVNYVPFFVLMLITPGLAWQRRVSGIAVGIPLIFLCHVGLVATEAFAQTAYRPTDDAFSTIFPAAMLTDAFPFMLWAIVAQDRLRGWFEPLDDAAERESD